MIVPVGTVTAVMHHTVDRRHLDVAVLDRSDKSDHMVGKRHLRVRAAAVPLSGVAR